MNKRNSFQKTIDRGSLYATRFPILLSPCEYDIGKFKSCVNAAASSSNTDYRLIWKNCITFANGVVRNCKANAKR